MGRNFSPLGTHGMTQLFVDGKDIFPRVCKRVNRMLSKSAIIQRDSKLLQRLEKAKARLRVCESAVTDLQFLPKIDERVEEAEDALRKARLEVDKLLARREQKAFHESVTFLGWAISPKDVLNLALVAATCALLLSLIIGWVALSLLGLRVLIYLAPLMLAIPILVFLLTASYPEIKARRARLEALGRAPEAINYMAMSLRVDKSLDRALMFAIENCEEPMRSALIRCLWDLWLRRRGSAEAALLSLADEWKSWSEDFKRSLYSLITATLETTPEGLERTLQQSRATIHVGTHRTMERFATSLRGPTTALFAMGILLPLMLGALLPMISLGNLGVAANPGTVSSDGTLGMVLILDVVFPIATLAYAYHILGRRPGTSMPVSDRMSSKRLNRFDFLLAFVLVVSLATMGFLPLPLASVLFPLWGIASAISYLMWRASQDSKAERDYIAALEEELPDALFLVGGRLSEGESLENSLRQVAEASKDSHAGELFNKCLMSFQSARGDAREALFGPKGLLAGHPSGLVRASMRLAVEVSAKDPAGAGKVVVDASNYLREMAEVKAEIKRELSSVVESMKATAVFFAPVVLGVTAALYLLLSKAFASLATLPTSPGAFIAILGLYLLALTAIVVYFTVGVEHGKDRILFRWTLARTLPQSIAIFSLSVIVARAWLGA